MWQRLCGGAKAQNASMSGSVSRFPVPAQRGDAIGLDRAVIAPTVAAPAASGTMRSESAGELARVGEADGGREVGEACRAGLSDVESSITSSPFTPEPSKSPISLPLVTDSPVAPHVHHILWLTVCRWWRWL